MALLKREKTTTKSKAADKSGSAEKSVASAKKTATKKTASKSAEKSTSSKSVVAGNSNARMRDYDTLLRPVVTEKASSVGGALNKTTVVFRVDCEATKTDVKQAIERVFGVQVEKVRTINVLGKVKRSGRSMGRRQSTKKAYVTLKEGSTIDLVEGV